MRTKLGLLAKWHGRPELPANPGARQAAPPLRESAGKDEVPVRGNVRRGSRCGVVAEQEWCWWVCDPFQTLA